MHHHLVIIVVLAERGHGVKGGLSFQRQSSYLVRQNNADDHEDKKEAADCIHCARLGVQNQYIGGGGPQHNVPRDEYQNDDGVEYKEVDLLMVSPTVADEGEEDEDSGNARRLLAPISARETLLGIGHAEQDQEYSDHDAKRVAAHHEVLKAAKSSASCVGHLALIIGLLLTDGPE